jgi:hypothetical protein
MHMTSIEELADRQEIYDVVLTYCRGIDRLDMDLVRSCYHPEGVDHHTGFEGKRDDYVAWVGDHLLNLAGTMHMVGNHFVRLDGDAAVSETYGTAFHLGDPAKGTVSFTTGFRWVDRFERRDGAWRIAERFALREWSRAEPDQRAADPSESPTGSRSKDDPIYSVGL